MKIDFGGSSVLDLFTMKFHKKDNIRKCFLGASVNNRFNEMQDFLAIVNLAS